jgi:DNA-binding beta-propeller fold protein YncE
MRLIFAVSITLWSFGMGMIVVQSADGRSAARDGGAVAAYRVVVADAKTPVVRVIDLDQGTLLATYILAGPARLHRSTAGRYVYAVQGEPGHVAILDSGVAVETHGDHSDIQITKPRLLPSRLSGPRPSHLNRRGDIVAVFFDGDGTAQVIREQDFVEGRTRQVRRVETGAGHHGVAKPVGRQLAITVAPAEAGLPNAIELRDADNKASNRIDCPRLHGEGSTGRFVVFGCADGVAIFETGRETIAARRLAYPETIPSGRMIRNMAGAAGFSFLAGDFGADGMVVFDPSSADGDFHFVELSGRRMHFDLHPEPGDILYVLIEDGTLLGINPMKGAIEAQARVTDRYSMEQGVVHPRVTSVGPYVVVSNPAAGEIVILDAQTLAERRRVKVEGTPFDVLAVGGSGSVH